MEETPPPKFLGGISEISITGMLCPYESDTSPCPFSVPGSPHFYICVFEDEDQLHTICKLAGKEGYKIKKITDGPTFTEDVFGYDIRIMVNPRMKDNGKLGWTELNKEAQFGDIPKVG